MARSTAPAGYSYQGADESGQQVFTNGAGQRYGSDSGGSGIPIIGSILGGAGSILSALTNWYAVGEQRKENTKARDLQEKLFYENLGFEKTQADRNYGLAQEQMGLNKRQLLSAERLGTRQQRLAESTARSQTGLALRAQTESEGKTAAEVELGKRGMTVQETESAANIALQGRAQTLNEKTAKFDQAATLITNMTRFFNSPATRSQYAGLWRGYGR